MTRGMMEVNFPQYIHREARDFFYLTRRALLPGQDLAPPITPKEAAEGEWRVKGLPQHGFPYALATTELRPNPETPSQRVRVLRLDPKAIRPAASAGTTAETPTVVSLFARAVAPVSLWWRDEIFLSGGSPGPGARRVASGVPLGTAVPKDAGAVVGVEDLDGMLDWIEIDGASEVDAQLLRSLDRLLAGLGCSRRLALDAGAIALVGGSTDLRGTPASPPSMPFVRFVRGTTPAAHAYFADTPIVGPTVWQPLQSKRVRYFPKPSPPAPAGSTSLAPPPPAGSAPPEKTPGPASTANGR